MKYIPCAILLLTGAANLHAAAVISSWSATSGTLPPVTGTTASPVFGDGVTLNNADNFSAKATVAGGTLTNTGDSITLSGSVTFTGGVAGNDNFRIGLFDVNGQSGDTGWLGYVLSVGANPAHLHERNSGNTNVAVSTSSGVTLLASPATGAGAFTNSTYAFSLTYTRQANASLTIDYGFSNGTYNASGSFNDTTPLTYKFDRVSFLSGGNFDAEQIAFSNLDVSVAAVPEPSSFALMGASVIAAGLVRRRKTVA